MLIVLNVVGLPDLARNSQAERELPTEKGPVFGAQIAKACTPKYNTQKSTGKVDGYGKVYL